MIKHREQTKMVRHGDVLLIREGDAKKFEPAKGAKPNLAEGERTGHFHRIFGEQVLHFVDEKRVSGERDFESGLSSYGGTLLLGGSGGSISHVTDNDAPTGEHDTIALDAGSYKVIHQREYDPERARRMAD